MSYLKVWKYDSKICQVSDKPSCIFFTAEVSYKLDYGSFAGYCNLCEQSSRCLPLHREIYSELVAWLIAWYAKSSSSKS